MQHFFVQLMKQYQLAPGHKRRLTRISSAQGSILWQTDRRTLVTSSADRQDIMKIGVLQDNDAWLALNQHVIQQHVVMKATCVYVQQIE